MNKKRTTNGFAAKWIDGRVGFLCHPPPGASEFCVNEWDGYVAAKKRLDEIESMSVQEIKALLCDRGVPVSSGDDKQSLVRKVVVTDRKKKLGVDESLLLSRTAPGSDIRDRLCRHGISTWEYSNRHATGAYMYGLVAALLSQQNWKPGYEAAVEHWRRDLDILRDDLAERSIARGMWSIGVTDATQEDCNHNYVLKLIAGSLIVNAMQDVIAETSNFTNVDATRLLEQPSVRKALDTISAGKNEMFILMDHPDYRKCNCMAYLATAAEIGKTWRNKLKISKDIEHCALCKEALAAPKVCSACKEVAYCSVVHQREHWKTHKKTCSGRAKK